MTRERATTILSEDKRSDSHKATFLAGPDGPDTLHGAAWASGGWCCLHQQPRGGGGSTCSARLATNNDAVVAERGRHFDIAEPGFLEHPGQLAPRVLPARLVPQQHIDIRFFRVWSGSGLGRRARCSARE